MKTLRLDASDDEILALLSEWLELLAEERYQDALDLLEPHADPAYRLTANEIAAWIRNYGSFEPFADGSVFRVTDPAAASGTPESEVGRYESPREFDEAIGYVWQDVPLNGEWSDLVAQFDLVRRDDRLVLVLETLHVP